MSYHFMAACPEGAEELSPGFNPGNDPINVSPCMGERSLAPYIITLYTNVLYFLNSAAPSGRSP
jgi:hypothetical protein